ncbi:MAG: SDR family oxidoreductase [Planctomycetota bacterium]
MNAQMDRPVCLVTGAGSGIGRAVCHRLSEAGWRLALVGRRAEKLTETGESLGREGADWVRLPADVSVAAKAEAIVGRTVEAFGRIDALVNNAGASPLKNVGQLETDEIESIFALNAVAPAVSAAAAVRAFKAGPNNGSGTIVTVSSVAAFDPFPGLGVYGAAKASTNTLAKALASEHSDDGVRALTVAPGAVETPLLRSLFDTDMLPESQTLSPDDIAAVIVGFILGERDDENGSTVTVNSPS